MSDIIIRRAASSDAARLLEIYAPYVERTAISFEYDVPTVEEFRARIDKTMARYPWLVLEIDGRPEGYAYAGPFKARAAYDRSCETSIYLSGAAQGQGFGRRLYAQLEDALRSMGMLNMYACIAYPPVPDEYLTANSAGFHAHLGFVTVGHFHQCGFKFGRWYDMVWMEKMIGPHGAAVSD